MIRGGRPGKVFRAPKRDRHGDPVDLDGNPVDMNSDGQAFVGVVRGVVMGGLSASPSLRQGEASDTSGQIGIPNENPFKVRFGDRILIDSVSYKVTSRPRWDYAQSMSGTRPQMHWVSVEARTDG